jgi:hypothetical protein
MLANGLLLVADLAVEAAASAPATRFRTALILGCLREDVLFLPFPFSLPLSLHGRVTEYPSFSHFYRPGLPGGYLPLLWPGPRRCADRLYARALGARREGRLAEAFVLLGRTMHLLADMSIPTHTHRMAHERDPFEWYVEGNIAALRALPVPSVAPVARASGLIESMARASTAFAPDGTNTPLGRLLRRAGLRRKPSIDEVARQAEVLLPLGAGHGAALLAMFDRDAGAAG